MAIVLYALGVGLIGWSGYLLASGDSYAALDIASRLAGWGVFAIGLGAIASALRRLTHAVKTFGRVSRHDSAPAASPFGALKRGALFRTAAAEEPAATEPRLSEPRREALGAPGADPAPSRPRAAPPVLVTPPPVDEPRLEPEPEPELKVMAAPEPRPELEPERETPRDLEEEASAEEPETETPAEAAAEPEIGDDPDFSLSRKERRQRRREAKQREEAFERPQVVAPLLGGGQLFAGRDRRLEAVGPVAPPMERAERPVFRTQEPDVEAGPIEPPASESELIVEKETPIVVDERASQPSGTLPKDFGSVPVIQADPEPARLEASKLLVAEPGEPKAVESPAPEPKVPDWLARARARREARAALDKPPAQDEAPRPSEASEPVDAGTAEPEPAARDVEDVREAVPAAEEAAPDARSEEEAPVAEPQVVREGEHRGVTYRFFDDGSVEALSPHGSRRFSTVEELRATVIAARGPGYVEPEPDSPPAPYETLRTPPSAADPDPLEAALSELEGEKSRESPARRG